MQRTQLNIEIGKELMKELKKRALNEDMPIKKWVIRALLKEMNKGNTKKE